MATVNFRDILSKPVTSAEKPKPRPPGTYQGIIEKFVFDESKKQKTPFVRLALMGVQPGPDVDQAVLADAGGAANWKPHRDYYLTDDALYRLRELIESCGINTSGRSFNETIPELKGKPVAFTAVLENTTNEQTGEVSTYTNISDMKGLGASA